MFLNISEILTSKENKDENVQRSAIRGKLLEREKERATNDIMFVCVRERELEKEQQII